MSPFAPIGHHPDAAMDPLVPADAMTAVRHRAVMLPRLLAGVVMLVGMMIYLVPRGMPSASAVA